MPLPHTVFCSSPSASPKTTFAWACSALSNASGTAPSMPFSEPCAARLFRARPSLAWPPPGRARATWRATNITFHRRQPPLCAPASGTARGPSTDACCRKTPTHAAPFCPKPCSRCARATTIWPLAFLLRGTKLPPASRLQNAWPKYALQPTPRPKCLPIWKPALNRLLVQTPRP